MTSTERYRAKAPDLFDVGERGADPAPPEPQVAARARASDAWFLIDGSPHDRRPRARAAPLEADGNRFAGIVLPPLRRGVYFAPVPRDPAGVAQW